MFKNTNKTMALYQSDEVIINIWTSKDNTTLEGHNVGHISLEFSGKYASLWPAPRQQTISASELSTLDKIKRKISRYFDDRPPQFKANYDEDCITEALSENRFRPISNINDCQSDERPILLDSEANIQPVVYQPTSISEDNCLLAVKPIQAGIRLALYGLDKGKMLEAHKQLEQDTKHWRLIGSNLLQQHFSSTKSESCASFALQLLKAGGIEKLLSLSQTSSMSSEGSSIISPDTLAKYVIKAKAEELARCNESNQWSIQRGSDLNNLMARYNIKLSGPTQSNQAEQAPKPFSFNFGK